MSIQTHVAIIEAKLPGWLKRAARPHQTRLKALMKQLQSDSDALNALVADLPKPAVFATNLLQAEPQIQRWIAVNGFGTAVDAVRRARVSRTHYIRDPALTVVKAAMQNFPPADAVTGSDFDKDGVLYIQGRSLEFLGAEERSNTAALPMSPAEFARLCRRINAGGAYRQVLESRLPHLGAEVPAIAHVYMSYARSRLAYDAYEAKLDGRLDETGERMLAHVGVHLEERPAVPLACEVKSLELLSVPLFGARVYWGVQGNAEGVRPVVLHMPHDAVAPLKQFKSLQAMSAELIERVRKRSYRQSLMHYFPLRLQASLGTALHDQVEWRVDAHPNVMQEIYGRITGWREGERGEDGTRERIRVPMPKVAWGLGDLREQPWPACYREWRGHVLANAATLMVPTEEKDWQARMARFAYWESLAERALMVTAMLFPFYAPVGMTAAAVGGAQMVYEIFEGIQAFNEGQAQEGIDHIFNVLFGIAQGAYLGFVGGTLEPMSAHDGSTRLWNGDVRSFRAQGVPPAEAEQDAWGVWRTPEQAWVRIDDDYFEVQGAGDALDLRLPADHRGIRPPLKWNRARGWQWAHRDPMRQGNLELLRSFAETPSELDDQTILSLQRQTGINEEHLRYLQVEGQPLPAILADSLDDARNWQDLKQAVARLRRNESMGGAHFRIVQTLVDLPGWPRGATLRYDDGVRVYPIGRAGDVRFIRLTSTDLQSDAWANYLLSNLGREEQTEILGQRSIGLRPAERSRLLGDRWADLLERNAARVTDGMRRGVELDPLAAPIKRAFPGMPESIANELARQTTGVERLRLVQGRVAGDLGDQCAEALRELRLTRALGALERGESTGDRDRLVMGLLDQSPLAKGRLHLRLWSRELRTPLELEGEGPMKTIRQEGERYQPFDEQGEELAGPLPLEEALLRAMPDDARKALGLDIWEATKLRTRLLDQALDDRQALRGFLQMKRIGDDGPGLQSLNGRMGYPLSGRGRLPLSAWRNGLDHRIEQLYPGHAGDAMVQLRLDLSQQARRAGTTLEVYVDRLQAQWTALDQELHHWESHGDVHHPAENLLDPQARAEQRRIVGGEIRRAWRRTPIPGQEGSEVRLKLSGHYLGRLPTISANFEHIEELMLTNLSLDEDPSDFLRLFPNIDTLHLRGNQLNTIPVAAGELRGLLELSMKDNPLLMTADVFVPLLGGDSASNLHILNLSGVSSGVGPSMSAATVEAIGRLAELPSLQDLVWADNLHFTPEQLRAIAALPELRILNLSRCGLRLDEEGSAFLRTATGLEELALNGNNCTHLPSLPELRLLRDLGLANTGLDTVPPAALAMLSNPSAAHITLDLMNNRISNIQDDLLPLLGGEPTPDVLAILLQNNPLPSAQIQALRVLRPEAFRYTADDWLEGFDSFRGSLEAARDEPGNRRFIDWFSVRMTSDINSADPGLPSNARSRGAAVLQHYTNFEDIYAELPSRLTDFDPQLAALRSRLQQRILDRVSPDLSELEVHISMFITVQRARLLNEPVPFASFMRIQYDFWNYSLSLRPLTVAERAALMSREAFIDWLCTAQDIFNDADQVAHVGETTWRPYLGLMSRDWTEGAAIWESVDEKLSDAFSEPVDPAGWPQALLDNLRHPAADLPSAWEHAPVDGQMVWRRANLEAVNDVEWTAGQPVALNDDQFRRTMAIYRSVRTREIDALVRRVTTDLVDPWWPLRPQ
ncbi:leucine-rich repeat domain-containing protein [Pseudomonas sp. R4-84]